MEILPQQFRIPEIYGNYWLNSEPIHLGALHGYAIMVNFWDYTCGRCLRELPYLKEWYKRYSDKGLVMLGVHTPQFPFARDLGNVQNAINKLNVKYPVVMDNDYLVWNAFRCVNWPTKFLIDKSGYIRYVHAGIGQYQNIEYAIQSLLSNAGYRDDMPLIMEPVCEMDRPSAISYRETPDILTGWQRGTIGNVEGHSPESTVHYEDPKIYVEGRVYLQGDWLNDRNYIKLNTEEPNGGTVTLIYQGKEVNAVIKPEGEKGFQVFVEHDDTPLSRGDRGADIRYDEEGRSYFVIDEARLFNIILNRGFGEHKLKLSTRSNGFALYSISFVPSVIEELTAYSLK
jgi:thiol-disulfide isomerase/thioredoxin